MSRKVLLLPPVVGETPEELRKEINTLILTLERQFTIPDLFTVPNNAVSGYENSYADVSGQEVRWYKDGLGRVNLWGKTTKNPANPPETMFTLPTDFRPSRDYEFWPDNDVITIKPSGAVELTSTTGSPTIFNLTGINFLTEG